MIRSNIVSGFNIMANMGFRYFFFKAGYLVLKRTRLIRLWFPTGPAHSDEPKAQKQDAWVAWSREVHVGSRRELLAGRARYPLQDQDLVTLRQTVERIRSGETCLYRHSWLRFVDWHTNPVSGYSYPTSEHWSAINEMAGEAGDIKHVWEMSRFGFVYDLIRFDLHSGEDQSDWVFDRIDDWITHNPVNLGVNWICGQEISLRVLTWLFALRYYAGSKRLDGKRFERIMESIYSQTKRVKANHWVAKQTLRNNHAITEALLLFVVGKHCPFFGDSAGWKSAGKHSLEEEVALQITPDGAYCQQSMNYHRVLIQLLTHAIRVAIGTEDDFSPQFYAKARTTLHFLTSFQTRQTGGLPNYGPNDGALFFPLTSCDQGDFTPELAPLYVLLGEKVPYDRGKWLEALIWNGVSDKRVELRKMPEGDDRIFNYASGYYTLHQQGTMSFLRCTNYDLQRPFQADNLHLDLWVNGVNIMRDAGTYSYNTDATSLQYFSGGEAHNTVVVEGFDQMLKGPRFTWTHWVKQSACTGWRKLNDDDLGEVYKLSAEFTGFRQSGYQIRHHRTVTLVKDSVHWIVSDQMFGLPPGWRIRQLWHPCAGFGEQFTVIAKDQNGTELVAANSEGWYSPGYGRRERAHCFYFSTDTGTIRTEIRQNV